MTVLHLSNDYSGSTIYMNLCCSLDKLGVKQIVYHPLRDSSRVNKNRIEFEVPGSEIIYSPILSTYTRINYPAKIKRILNDLYRRKINLKEVDLIHAHTWYSDGGVAYELYKKYRIPYIVAIRSTDLNLFFKYMIHLRKYGIAILKHAQRIVFISPMYKDRLLEEPVLLSHRKSLEAKSQMVPNGVGNFWVSCRTERHTSLVGHGEAHLLFIGSLSKRKNVAKLIQAVNMLNIREATYYLSIVGNKANDFSKIMSSLKESEYCTYLGEIRDKTVLRKIFSEHDIFVMPSKKETFGLVYIEALSQGLPIVYTKNEGVDGLYTSVGEAVDPHDVEDIANGIRTVYENYNQYEFEPEEIVQNHNWQKIAGQYEDIYHAVVYK